MPGSGLQKKCIWYLPSFDSGQSTCRLVHKAWPTGPLPTKFLLPTPLPTPCLTVERWGAQRGAKGEKDKTTGLQARCGLAGRARTHTAPKPGHGSSTQPDTKGEQGETGSPKLCLMQPTRQEYCTCSQFPCLLLSQPHCFLLFSCGRLSELPAVVGEGTPPSQLGGETVQGLSQLLACSRPEFDPQHHRCPVSSARSDP